MGYLVTREVLGQPMALPDFPENKAIAGIGLSDAEAYAKPLAHKFDYENTFYHTDPRLDIADIDDSHVGRYDFVVASDVFEHVAPPVSRAFVNARRMLKPGGKFIFTVPFIARRATRASTSRTSTTGRSPKRDGAGRSPTARATGACRRSPTSCSTAARDRRSRCACSRATRSMREFRARRLRARAHRRRALPALRHPLARAVVGADGRLRVTTAMEGQAPGHRRRARAARARRRRSRITPTNTRSAAAPRCRRASSASTSTR